MQILRQHTNLGLFSNVNYDPSRPLTTFHDLARWKRKTLLIFILFIFHPYALLVCGRSWAPEETSRNTLLYIVCYQTLSLTQRSCTCALPLTQLSKTDTPRLIPIGISIFDDSKEGLYTVPHCVRGHDILTVSIPFRCLGTESYPQ